MTVAPITLTTKGATTSSSWPYMMPIVFLYVDIGCNGGGVWKNTSINNRIATETPGMPNDSVPRECEEATACVCGRRRFPLAGPRSKTVLTPDPKY